MPDQVFHARVSLVADAAHSYVVGFITDTVAKADFPIRVPIPVGLIGHLLHSGRRLKIS